MGIIKEYISQRRQQKLEEVTHALEELKRQNVATDSLKPKNTLSSPTAYAPVRSGRDLLFIGILLVCVVVFLILTFYYRSQFSTLQEEYDAKAEKIATLETELEEKLADLKDTKSLLKSKEDAEKELSGKSKTLESEIGDLEKEIAALKKDIAASESKVTNLTKSVSDQEKEINKWKKCVTSEYNGNLSKCG